MLFGLLASSLSIPIVAVGFSEVWGLVGEVLVEREARGLVGEGMVVRCVVSGFEVNVGGIGEGVWMFRTIYILIACYKRMSESFYGV